MADSDDALGGLQPSSAAGDPGPVGKVAVITGGPRGFGATALAALTGAEPETLPHKGLRVDARAALAGRASPELLMTRDGNVDVSRVLELLKRRDNHPMLLRE